MGYGARPLKRSIQRNLENPLAQELLAGHFLPDEIILADVEGNKITFNVAQKHWLHYRIGLVSGFNL